MATTRFYLDLRGKAQDGKGSVVITLAHNNTTATFSTGVRVSPQYWNGSAVIRSPDSEALNAVLIRRKSDIDRQLAILALDEDFESKTATQIKAEIDNQTLKSKFRMHLVSDIFADYMDKDLSDGTREIYKYTLKKVLSFGGENLVIERIDYKWLLQFEKFLISSGQSVNGRSVYLRHLRAICNYAINTGIKIDYPFRFFHIKSEPTKKRNVLVSTLREFYTLPTSKANEVYRDYFFLMFFLIGINIVDLLTAKKSQYDGERLEYIRRKTHKKYSIKVEPEAKALIEKYSGKGEYLLNALDHCRHYDNFMHMMNDALKTIGKNVIEEIPDPDDLFGESSYEIKLKPTIPDITTYFSRHTWSTLASDLDIPIDTISQALGHPVGNRTTLIYIKFDQKKIDEANRKVIDYFFSGLPVSGDHDGIF